MAKTRVLLVDDEKSFTNLLKLNLEETGKYEVRVGNDSRTVEVIAGKTVELNFDTPIPPPVPKK